MGTGFLGSNSFSPSAAKAQEYLGEIEVHGLDSQDKVINKTAVCSPIIYFSIKIWALLHKSIYSTFWNKIVLVFDLC